MDLTQDELLFFNGCPEALPIYAALRAWALAELPVRRVRALKTEIVFDGRRRLLGVSRLAVRRRAQRPPAWLTVSFCLPYRLDSPRVDAATEPYPNRWTHHVLLGGPEELDDQVRGWLREAAAFAEARG